jgi:hypothetical protein
MSAGRIIALTVLGLLIDAIAGGGLGLLGGLAYTELMGSTGFEGYSGFVGVWRMLAGIVTGMIAGLVVGVKRSRN